jgi:multidrug efflux pump subunit AcrA (membrane-fusion protein)
MPKSRKRKPDVTIWMPSPRPQLRLPSLAAWVVTLAAVGCIFPAPSVLAAETASPHRAVTVARAKHVCFSDTIHLTGVVVAANEILVRPEKEGLKVSQILVEAGDTVTSGQQLARLIPPEGSPGGTAAVTIQAPAAGVVNSIAAVVGAPASARAEPLFRIARQGEMELLTDTPVNSLTRLVPDQKARIEIIGIGELSGKVRQVSSVINPTTQLGQVRLLINESKRLRAGAFGRAIVEINRRCGPAVPFSAVAYSQDGSIIQVVRSNQVESRRVTVGLIEADQVEIREGLSEGEVVVARAGAFVRDGDRVRPVNVPESGRR